MSLRFHDKGEQLRLVHRKPDKGNPETLERGIERKSVSNALPIQFPGFFADGIPDSLNGSERGEDGAGAAAKPGAEVSGRQEREAP